MINKVLFVENDNISVGYSFNLKTVVVANKSGTKVSQFCGWESLKDDFDSFLESFSEAVTLTDAVEFFTPNITPKEIHGK